jgi:hypothetical protein
LKQGATGKKHRHTVLLNCQEKNKGLIVGELQKNPMKKKNDEQSRMNRKA